jgi:metal-responsive CopG/Arc/MetJ family transcriptional regulator
MKRATITIPDDLERALDGYFAQQKAPPSLTTVVQAALREYLLEEELRSRGFKPATGPLRITPAEGGEATDVSTEHDRYFVDDYLEERRSKEKPG